MEELKTYNGTNPKPGDFDAFWDKGLEEIRATKPDVEINESDFQTDFAKCSDLFFTGAGGARVHAKLLQPKITSGKAPAVLMFHGYSGDAGEWIDKLGYAAQGITVAAMDCRGQGGLSEDSGSVKGWTLRGHIVRGLDDAPEKLLFRSIFLDTAQLARVVMDMDGVDETRVGVTGRSQGGGLTLACASLVPEIKLAAPVFPFLCDYKRVWDLDLGAQAYAELTEYFRKFDALHERENEIFTKLGYIDSQHLAPRIKARVMMTTGLMDKVCPPSTQFAAYNKIKSEKSMVIYPDYAHEDLPGEADRIFQFMREL
jgi:cephalosporin-C deacetylase